MTLDPGSPGIKTFWGRVNKVQTLYCVGNLNWDMFFQGDRVVWGGAGGSVTNTAVSLRVLADQYKISSFPYVRIVSLVGDDAKGRQLRESISARGMDLSLIGTHPTLPTSQKRIQVDPITGEREITDLLAGQETATGALRPYLHEWVTNSLRQAESCWIHLKRDWTTVMEVVEEVISTGQEAIFSLDYSAIALEPPSREIITRMRGKFDVLFGNEKEARLIAGKTLPDPSILDEWPVNQVTTHLQDFFDTSLVFTKLGPRGAVGCCLARENAQDAICHHEPALEVQVLDTTGAGDAFNAGVIAGIISFQNVDDVSPITLLERVMKWGTRAGSNRCTHFGGQPSRQ